MSTPDIQVYRAIVQTADTTTGTLQVNIPALMGAGVQVPVANVGFKQNAFGQYLVPAAGTIGFVAVQSGYNHAYWVDDPGVTQAFVTNQAQFYAASAGSVIPAISARVAALEAAANGIGAGAPAGTGTNGDTYWDITNKRLYRSDGTGWIIMAEPVQGDTTLDITGVSLDGGLTTKRTWHRSDGYIDVESVTTFASGPSTLASLAWVPYIASRSAVGNITIGISWGSLSISFFDASAGVWYEGTNNEGTTSIGLFASFVSGTNIGIQSVSTSVPFLFTSGDKISVSGRYPMTTRYS